MASVSRALERIKGDLELHLSPASITAACLAAGHTWRERKLGPVSTVHLFVLQVLNFNPAIRHLRHRAGYAINAAAYSEARLRLPLAALQALLRESAAAAAGGAAAGEGLWCGLRTFLVDGSATIAPDTPSSQTAFGQPGNQKKGCGFPVPRILGLFDAFTGMVVEMLCFPLRTHEQSKVWQLHPLLKPGDVLVGDRGFCSFAHLAMLHARGVAGLFRMHQKQIVDFLPHRKTRRKGQKGKPNSRFVRRLGKGDQVVEWRRPKVRPAWMTAAQFDALPDTLRVRELRYHLAGKGRRTREVTIATTLLDPLRYPKDKVCELYGLRWSVETHFLELKTTLKMRRVKSQTAQGVEKELAVYCLVYNLVRALMVRASVRQGVTPDRISFVDTVRWLLSAAAPGQDVPNLVINPQRPDRHEPRVIKDLQDTYRKMTLPRAQMRRRLDLAKR
jgi:hypothetical protein